MSDIHQLLGSPHKGPVIQRCFQINISHNQVYPDNKVHGANMGPTWVLPAPDGPHISPMNRVLRVANKSDLISSYIRQQDPSEPFHKGLKNSQSKSCKKKVCWCVVRTLKVIFSSGHNFAHAMTSKLLWHVQNHDLIWSLEMKLHREVFSWNFNNVL